METAAHPFTIGPAIMSKFEAETPAIVPPTIIPIGDPV
jgi:hypothetical protein